MNPEPPPFGDPTNLRRENAEAIKKGVAFGCGGCASVLLLGVAVLAGLVAVILFSIRSSDPCVETWKRAQASSAIQQAIGTPVTLGWFVTGSINTFNSTGTAELSVPVNGPRGSLNVQTKATKTDGVWQYQEMATTLPDGQALSLLPPP